MRHAGAVYIFRVGGPFLALYLWGALLALSLVMMAVYPTLIAPLFNDFKPLPQGSLRCSHSLLACVQQPLVVNTSSLGVAAQVAD